MCNVFPTSLCAAERRRGRLRAALRLLGAFLLLGCSDSKPESPASPDTVNTSNDSSATASTSAAGGASATSATSSSGGTGTVSTTGSTGFDGGASGAAGGRPGYTGDDYALNVDVALHGRVSTILVVTWTEALPADEVWLEFSYEGGELMTSRPAGGGTGPHRDVILGVPGDTLVTARIVSRVGDDEYRSSDFQGLTGAVPSGMPKAEVMFDPELASPDRWLFGAVEDSPGGCASPACYYTSTFWLYIMNREGQIVWYYADPATNATSSFQRIARDGEYIWIEKRPFTGAGSRGVLKMTLDWEYYEEVAVPGLSDCIDVTDDGSLLYDVVDSWELREMTRDGDVRTIFSCPEHFGNDFECYSNTVNWNPLGDTVLMSYPEERTVIEVDRETGDVVGQYGDAPNSYAFSPASWEFEYQHFANITPEGTLLVSSHMPGYEDTREPVAGEHAFMEYTIDRQSETLLEKWVYNDGPEWAMFKGMAIRLPNGNTLANYGTGGVIREITPDKQTAFYVKFDVAARNDFFNKMVGNNVLLDDLYALNGGGPE